MIANTIEASETFLFDNLENHFELLEVLYAPADSNSGLHGVTAGGEDKAAKRTLKNGVVRLTKNGDAWAVGTCVIKGTPASFSTKDNRVKKILSVVWND